MTYIYVDINQWEMLIDSLHPNARLIYSSDKCPTYKSKPVIMMSSFYRGEQQETVGFVREKALDDL